MNTISQNQIFSPIPFAEFQPDIVHINDAKQVETDINRNHGRYDEYNYNNIAFYVRDYNASTWFSMQFGVVIKLRKAFFLRGRGSRIFYVFLQGEGESGSVLRNIF